MYISYNKTIPCFASHDPHTTLYIFPKKNDASILLLSCTYVCTGEGEEQGEGEGEGEGDGEGDGEGEGEGEGERQGGRGREREETQERHVYVYIPHLGAPSTAPSYP